MGSIPPEIANDLPAVVVMDNDDFKLICLRGHLIQITEQM